VLPRMLDLEKPSDFSSRVSLFTHIEDRIDSENHDRDKILITVAQDNPEVWYWLIPFSDGRSSFGMVCPPEYIEGLTEDQYLNKLKENAELEEACAKETPGKEMSRQEKHLAIREMVTQLPDSLREICSLFYLAQCSCKDISSILNISESNVKVGLHRARKKLLENGIGQWRSA